jgi:hypothetical protein
MIVRDTSRTTPGQSLKPLLPQPGSPIDPDNAVGRGAATQRARRELLARNNLCLNDPRRMGKTVWLDLFCRDPGAGITAIKIDYEGVSTCEEFLLRTVAGLQAHRGLPSQTIAKLVAMFDGVEVSAGPITVKAGVATRGPLALLSATVLGVEDHLDKDSLFVIAMDEVPIALANISDSEGPDAASRMLQTLRGLRQRQGQLRWILSGSIGFHHILRRCGATEGAVNDLVGVPLGPLDTFEAQELAERLLLGIRRTPQEDAVAALLDHSGCIPFLLHALAHRLHDAGTGTVSVRDVADAFTGFLDDRDDSRAMTHLVTRLDPLYGQRAQAAEEILDAVAVERSSPVTDLDAGGQLLNDLIDDHYLVERNGTVTWRYEVLRRIWVHRRRLA